MPCSLRFPCPWLTPVAEDFVQVGVWSTVESSVGIMCACMPAIRGLFGLMAPKLFGKTQRSDEKTWESQNMPKLSGTRRHFRVRSEIVVKTKHVDDSSVVELSPFQTDEEHHRLVLAFTYLRFLVNRPNIVFRSSTAIPY